MWRGKMEEEEEEEEEIGAVSAATVLIKTLPFFPFLHEGRGEEIG